MPDFTKRLDKAEKYLHKGKPELALEEYLAVLDEDPNNDKVRLQAADLCLSLDRERQATTLLAQLFDRQASRNDVTAAVTTYRKLQRITEPSQQQTLRYAAMLERNNKEEALTIYKTMLAARSAADRPHEALAAARRMVALQRTSENLVREAELAAQAGDTVAAADAYLAAAELDSSNGARWLERAYAQTPGEQKTAIAWARCLAKNGRPDEALPIVAPLATRPGSVSEAREVYGRALLAARRPVEAEPYIWELFLRNPGESAEMMNLLGSMIDLEHDVMAVATARKLEDHYYKKNQRREYLALVKELLGRHRCGVAFLEYAVEVFNANNRENDYSAVLLRLFDLHYAAGHFLKAGDCLDRAAEVDPYEPGHGKRLEMLRGKIDDTRLRAISDRFSRTAVAAPPPPEEPIAPRAAEGLDSEPTVLEDLMLQAEIFLQYSMRSRAVERLERISKLLPREEEKNAKLKSLYLAAGFVPMYDGVPAPAVAAAAAAGSGPGSATASPSHGGEAPPATATQKIRALADQEQVDNFSRVTEITRNIYRQGNVKGVLFSAVNDVGRHWNASRCVAGLSTPGKPPSAALEYCAPGVQPSEVIAIVKLISTLQSLAVTRGVVSLQNVQSAPELASMRGYLETLNVQSLLAVPLIDGEEHVGILILEQCDTPRNWRHTDVVVLKTICDQMVVAVSNARLRSLVKTLAVTDEKSGLLKRSSYLDVLLSEVKRAQQQQSTVTVMLLEFGRPGAMLKEFGESAVESLMQQLGQLACSHIRQNDVALRYELTTLALLLSDTNDKNAEFVVEKLRKVMGSVNLPGRPTPVPMTIGIAEAGVQPDFDPVDIVTEVINRAEDALDHARAEGGGKVCTLSSQMQTA